MKPAIKTAYRAIEILRVCELSLEGDAPRMAGDEAATATTIASVRAMVGDIVDAMECERISETRPETNADAIATLQWIGKDGFRGERASTSGGDTPILTLFRQFNKLTDAAEAHPPIDDEELNQLFYNERDRVEAKAMSLPCATPADFAAKVIMDTARGTVFGDWKTDRLWKEARELTGMSEPSS